MIYFRPQIFCLKLICMYLSAKQTFKLVRNKVLTLNIKELSYDTIPPFGMTLKQGPVCFFQTNCKLSTTSLEIQSAKC